MRSLCRQLRRARRAEGAVVVMVALTMPVLIGFGGLLLDVGNWYGHKRHLQLQADAGALAGAALYGLNGGCDNTAIRNEIAKYSSIGVSPGLNPQVGGVPQSRLHSLINSTTYYNQASPLDPDVTTGEPCAASMIDVKLTETNADRFLPGISGMHLIPALPIDHINARARVAFVQKTTSAKTLPVGVPEVGPKRAKAIFVNETTGAVLATTDLLRTGTNGGRAVWSNTAAPQAVTFNGVTKVGVRILLSGSSSTAPACGDTLVTCYGAGTNTAVVANSPGLVHIRGYSASTVGTVTAPKIRGAEAYGLSCEDGYFSALATYPCTVNVGVVLDSGGLATNAATNGGTRLYVRKTGANASTDVALTPPATQTGRWTGGAMSLASASGATSYDIYFQTGCNTNRTAACGSGGTAKALLVSGVQRTYVGSQTLATSGPIQKVSVSESGVPGANSFQSTPQTTHNLVVTIELLGTLANAQSVNDPVVSLKVAGGGSQNQSLDCDPAQANFRDQISNGCAPTYKINTGTACPAKNPLWASSQPWPCVVVSTGASVGQVTQGLNERILGSKNANTCTAPNHWSSYPNLPVGDPRIVEVFLTPYGSFDSSGSGTVPVTGFATFYITGWDGGACQGAGDDTAGSGAIVGHFFKYIDRLGNGSGTGSCDLNALGSCLSVFNR